MKKILPLIALFASFSAFAVPQQPINGGTGVSNNNANIISLGGPILTSGAFTLSGAFSTTIIVSANSIVTFPSGTHTLASNDGSNASGTWGINVSGNAATVTNGIYTAGSYSDPAWLTALNGSKLTGTVTANAISAGTYSISITGTAAGGAPPTGAASGDLTNNYPNPKIANNVVVSSGFSNTSFGLNVTNSTYSACSDYNIAGTNYWCAGIYPVNVGGEYAIVNVAGGTIPLYIDPSTSLIAISTLSNSQLVGTNGTKQLVSVNLSGDVATFDGFSTILATVNGSPGMTGSSSVVPVITYNGKGLVTSVSSATITPSAIGAPTTTGTGASGTWGINVTGSSATTTTATNANNGATVSTSTNSSFYPLFVASNTNSNQPFNLGSGLNFNPSTNNLTTTTFTGALVGNASTVTTNANLTGPVISVGNATAVTAASITNAMLAGSIDLTSKVTNTLPFSNGGFGFSTATLGDLFYASATNTPGKLSGVAVNQVLTSGGVGAAPAYSASPTLTGLTLSGLTSGSLCYAGTSGVISQDNSHLFYDSSGVHLYVGANSSTQTFQTPGALNTYGTNGTTNNALNFYTSADGYSGMSLFNDTHGNQAINFDSYWNGSANVSSYSGSNFQLVHLSNALQFNYASGITQGSSISYANGFYLDTSGNIDATNNIIVLTANKGITIKSAAVSAGTANAAVITSVTLSGGTVTINDSYVTTSTVCFFSVVTPGGTPGTAYGVTVAAGTVKVTSTSALDATVGNVGCLKGN